MCRRAGAVSLLSGRRNNLNQMRKFLTCRRLVNRIQAASRFAAALPNCIWGRGPSLLTIPNWSCFVENRGDLLMQSLIAGR